MKTYTAIIANNNQTEVIIVKANNLSNAKLEAEKNGRLIMIALDQIGSKIYK